MNIEYYRGDTLSYELYPKDSAGTPYDLTGFTGTFNIATARGNAGTFVASLAVTVDVPNEKIIMTLPASTGANLSSTVTYVYDIELVKGTEVYTLLTGNIVVTDDVKES
jgi:hypothetical protein